MKEHQAVRVSRRENYTRDYHLYSNRVVNNLESHGRSVGVQFNSEKDPCTCKIGGGHGKLHDARYFRQTSRQVYAYQRSRSYTDIGVGSVKALHKKKVKRVYLPETDDRGVGSTDLMSYVNRRAKQSNESSYYDQKKTSSKCVGGVRETEHCVLNAKLSPIIQTKSGTTSPQTLAKDQKPTELEIKGSEKKLAITDTKMETQRKVNPVTKNIVKPKVEIKQSEKVAKELQAEVSVKVQDNRLKDTKSFSSDSLVQHVHNLEEPSEVKTIDPMENKIEREFRKMFATKSKDTKPRSSTDKNIADLKSTSLLRRRFEALRRSFGKKEDSSNNIDAAGSRTSSQGSDRSRKDASVTSDPPSLEGRSYSNTKTYKYNPYQSTMNHGMPDPKKSYFGRKDDSEDWSQENVESDQGVKGMLKLWGKKFNLEDDYCKTSEGNSPSFEKKEKEEPINIEKKEKKERKKFFFFKKKNKEVKTKPKDTFTKPKKGVTAGRCEVRDGLMIKIGAANPYPLGKQKTQLNRSPESDILRKAWLMKFLTTPIESRNSVQVRWNNKTYTTSSSTVFELMENVYKETGVVFKSRSEIITDGTSSYYKFYTKRNVNFVQNVEAWMVPTMTHRPMICKSNKNNIELTISNQKWFIDKSKAFAQKIEVVLHSNNFTKPLYPKSSSEYLKIDIPKGFFSDSSSDDQHNQTSDEEVYKIVEYETTNSITDLDHLPEDIKVTISVKDIENNSVSKVLETVIKTPPVQRDVVVQSSQFYIPKKCDVIGVGIITQRDGREVGKPILKILDYDTEDDSEPDNNIPKKCEVAEKFLQDYYKTCSPLDVDILPWRLSDSRLSPRLSNGDVSKSCLNIYEDFKGTSSSCSQCVVATVETEDKKKDKKKKDKDQEDGLKRITPKDSVEVFKKRKLYAQSKKSEWVCPDLMPHSTPSQSERGTPDTLIACPKQKPCCEPMYTRPPTKKFCKKHVSLKNCESMNEDMVRQMQEGPGPGILAFKRISGCDVCKKKGQDCPKHARVDATKICEIPDPGCKKFCAVTPEAPCEKKSSPHRTSPLPLLKKVCCKKKSSSTKCPSPPPCRSPSPRAKSPGPSPPRSPGLLHRIISSTRKSPRNSPPCQSPRAKSPGRSPPRSPGLFHRIVNSRKSPGNTPPRSESPPRHQCLSPIDSPEKNKKKEKEKPQHRCATSPCRDIPEPPKKKPSPPVCNTPPCKKASPIPKNSCSRCHTPPQNISVQNSQEEFPWPTNNQVSNQSSLIQMVHSGNQAKDECERSCTLSPKNSHQTIKQKKSKECIPNCANRPKPYLSTPAAPPKPPRPEYVVVPPPECTTPPPLGSPPCPTRSKISGLFLKKLPSKKKTCPSECAAWERSPDNVIRLNSREKITIRLRKENPSTEEIREATNVKLRDEDGQTICERKDYTSNPQGRPRCKPKPQCGRNVLVGDMYQDSKVNRVTTVNQVESMEQSQGGDTTKSKSDTSVANLIEINFKLRVCQGDKTTEINIENEKDNNEDLTSHGKTQPQQVFRMKDEDKSSIEEYNPKNDVNIRILIKNYKPKSVKKRYSDKCTVESVMDEDFSKKISDKFHTVSTGYSSDFKDGHSETSNVFSVHRATVDLTSSTDKSKCILGASDRNLDQKSESSCRSSLEILSHTKTQDHIPLTYSHIIAKSPQDLITVKENLNQEALIDVNQLNPSKKYSMISTENNMETEENIDLTETKSIKYKIVDSKSAGKKELHEKILTNNSEVHVSLTDNEDTDANRFLNNKTSEEFTDTDTKTDEHDTDRCTSDDHVEEVKKSFLMPKIFKQKIRKEDKKKMLKEVLENATYLQKPKTKSRIRRLKDMLKAILTSDSSEPEEMVVPSSDLARDLTYASLKPNFFKDSESLNNYFMSESALTSENCSDVKPSYPTEENNSICSGEDSEWSIDDGKEKACLCSELAARLKCCAPEEVGRGCCCAKKAIADQETTCDFRNDGDYFLLNNKSVEFVDAETQNSMYKDTKLNSINISSDKSKDNDIEALNSLVADVKESYKSCQENSIVMKDLPQNCYVKDDDDTTLLGVSDNDKIVIIEANSTKASIKSKAGSKEMEHSKEIVPKINPVDILQLYETKKAVLGIYAERTATDDGEQIVAKLPRFAYGREREICEKYERYTNDTSLY